MSTLTKFMGDIAEVWDPPHAVEIGSTWRPQPKQVFANERAGYVDELLYGGAAGGGKTEWLVNYFAEQMERYPNNRGVIFRRVFPSLNRTIVPRAREILASRARWRGDERTFTFDNGSVLELSSLQYKDDVYKYYGVEYGVIGFEEITEFLKSQYEYMLGRLRAPAWGITPHAVATTNPGGVGHIWVKQRWITPRDVDLREGELCTCGCGFFTAPRPFEPWHPAATPEVPHPLTRCFIPARISDNPALERRDPGYLNRLLGAISNRGLRKALAEGDWEAIDAKEGALVTHMHLETGRVRPDPTRAIRRRVVAVDTSDGQTEGDEYGIASVSLGVDGHIYVEFSDGWRASPATLAKQTVAQVRDRGADVCVVERNHGGKWVPALLKTHDPYLNVKTKWAGTGKLVRWEPVAALFEPDEEGEVRAHLVGFHPELEDEMTSYTGAPGERSPNRLDAVVWAIHEIGLGHGGATVHVPRNEAASNTDLAITRRVVRR